MTSMDMPSLLVTRAALEIFCLPWQQWGIFVCCVPHSKDTLVALLSIFIMGDSLVALVAIVTLYHKYRNILVAMATMEIPDENVKI